MLIVDTREKEETIFKTLDKMKVQYKQEALVCGDYTFEEKRNIVVERKSAIDFLTSYVSGHMRLKNQLLIF